MRIHTYGRKQRTDIHRESNDEDKRHSYYIHKDKVQAFAKLFNRVALVRGGKIKAQADLNLADSTMDKFRSGMITKETAAKILDGYNKYVKNYLNSGIITN